MGENGEKMPHAGGAHHHGEALSYEEALAESLEERRQWDERDRKNGTVYVHPKYLPKQRKVKPKPEELFIGPPDPRAGRKR